MKKLNVTLLAAFFLICLSSKSHADEKKTVKSTLENATVFFQGAELTHKASVYLNKGDNEIWVEGLSPNIDRNSLKIKATDSAVITAYEFSIDYLNEKNPSPIEKRLQDSINIYQKQYRDIEVKMKTNEDLINLLNANKTISGSQNGLSVAELIKMMDYYQSKSNELQNAKRIYEDTQKRLEERIEKLQNQLNQETVKNKKTSGILKINLTASIAGTSNFQITYYTASSGWTPFYDINVTGTDRPIKIVSKAKVRQTTGLDWNKVKLTLSTSAPSTGKIAPLFKTWFLDFQSNYTAASPRTQKVSADLMMQNSYSYEEIAEPVVAIRGAGNFSGSTSPLLIVDGIVMDNIELDDIDQSTIKSIDVLKDSNATAIYGARAVNGVIVVTTKNSMEDYISRDENQLNMVYNIDLPYTIQGNGKEQNIELQSYDIPAEFKYYSIPKLDTETFLLAEISGWEKLGLLTGKANITYDGTYVGETTIDVSSTQEKLSLTLGTDKRVAVKREKLQDFSSKKFFNNDIKQEFAYQITVKNNQNQPVKMVLKDQYPLSAQKDIEVELSKEITPATFNNENVGVLSWEFELKPGETKVFKNAYTVKYPKGKSINL